MKFFGTDAAFLRVERSRGRYQPLLACFHISGLFNRPVGVKNQRISGL